MGVSLTQFVSGRPLKLEELKGKIIVIDTFNFLYQFLSSLRGPDGNLLTTTDGRVTSHLVGLLSRSTKLMQLGIKCAFVFDGEAPALKEKERMRRRKIKEEAQVAYDQAVAEENVEDMRKFATRTTKLTPEMVEDAKKLVEALGLPMIQAPSEGEAQAAHMVKVGDADFVVSQDTDALLFGAPRVIKNLSILGKKKKLNKLSNVLVEPELVTLEEVVNALGIDREKLIILSMLVGTDFNVGGIKGIGPKRALALVKQHDDYNQLFLEVNWGDHFDYDWHDVFELFTDMPFEKDYNLTWKPVNAPLLTELLSSYEFSQQRIDGALEKLEKATDSLAQKGLGDFF
ncbi:MAG: flap endonuclease-1 [Candidatus Woesearchaeota archaeon]|jgi:flap endonuclease-1